MSGRKEQLLLDSGFRTHLTDFTRATTGVPSAFTSRLRKFLKTRRCTSVSQVGTDRIIELQFTDGAWHLYLEFFAAGNIILTDAENKILAIFRNVHEGEGQEPQRIGLTYSLHNRQNFGGVPPLTEERVRKALETSVKKAEAAENSAKKKHKRKAGDELRRGLATTLEELPPIVVDHAFEVTGFDSTSKPADILENEELFDALFKALEQAREVVDGVTSSATCKGYIIAKKQDVNEVDGAAAGSEKSPGFLYEDFQPFLPRKYEKDAGYTTFTFDNFNKTIDEFFSSIEGQKLESKVSDREAAAKRKLEAIKEIQEQKVEGLKEAQMLNLRKAGAIEANTERVTEAIEAVNGLVLQGMDWVNIGKLIEREQRRNNPVASIIKLPLNLEQNTITLLLAEELVEEAYDDEREEADEGYQSTSEEGTDDENDEEERKAPDTRLAIEVNLGLTPFANAREYYDQKKVAAVKEQKTVEHSATALKSAEKKIAQDLKKGLKQEKPTLHLTRRQMWFEKFLWFVSSDGYLVLGGRDASSNELLYKKHLRKGDVYVHADMHGAASVVIKNNPKTPDSPIPPSTLAQAGSLSVCSSNAWDSKAGMGAWWVNAEQVSKSAPTGEFLPTGSFMIRGNKNILTPQPLTLGFGFMFKISEESKANHVKHRFHEAEDSYGVGSSASKPDETKNLRIEIPELADGHEEQGDNVHSDDEQEDGDHSERQNPLQNAAESDSEDEVHPVGDTDHVKDDLQKLSISESVEAMMSGALTADTGEHETADGHNESKEAEEEAAASDADDAESEADTEAPTEAPSLVTVAATTELGQNKGPAKRGRRAKQKKIAAKYKDQDEEDRAMHEELIGAAKGRQKAEAEARAREEKQAEEEARRERRKQAQRKQQQKLAEQEEIRRVMLDEGVAVLDEDEEQAATPLDALVGTAFPGDEILEAVPVCAPWAAMGKFKYKVKIQPGSTKKGKALKEILERWKLDAARKGSVDEAARDAERMWPREVELLKAAKPEEANNVVPVGKMTVMVGGGAGGGSGGGGKSGGKGGQGKGGRGGKGGKKR